MESCNRVLNRDQLIEQASGHEFPGITKSVEVCILRLRKKLQRHLTGAGYIQTTRGFGYKFEMPREATHWRQRAESARGAATDEAELKAGEDQRPEPARHIALQGEDQG